MSGYLIGLLVCIVAFFEDKPTNFILLGLALLLCITQELRNIHKTLRSKD